MPVGHLGVRTNTRESSDGHLVKFCLGHEYAPLLWGWLSVLTQPQLLQLLEQTSMLGLFAVRLQTQFPLSCNDRLLYRLPSPQCFHSFILPLLQAMMEHLLCASTALRTGDMALSKIDYFVSVSILWHWILLSTSKVITLNLNLKSNPASITYDSRLLSNHTPKTLTGAFLIGHRQSISLSQVVRIHWRGSPGLSVSYSQAWMMSKAV